MSFAVNLLPSLSRTASPTGPVGLNTDVAGSPGPFNQAGRPERGVKVIVNITANPGGLGSITVTIRGFNQLTNTYWTILASIALTAVAATILTVWPGATASANSIANDVLPTTWDVAVVHNNANPITYSVDVQGVN